jgi:CO/xanthine dehydrogenase Mo-binding subunit
MTSRVGDIKVLMLPEKEEIFNPLGIKAIGELGNVGMSAAVVNAVYHAMGTRVRRFPVHLEILLAGLDALRSTLFKRGTEMRSRHSL